MPTWPQKFPFTLDLQFLGLYIRDVFWYSLCILPQNAKFGYVIIPTKSLRKYLETCFSTVRLHVFCWMDILIDDVSGDLPVSPVE